MRLEIQDAAPGMTDDLREHVGRHFDFALGPHGERLGRVSVRLARTRLRRASPATSCRVWVSVLPTRSGVLIEVTDPDPGAAVARAAHRAGKAVERRLRA